MKPGNLRSQGAKSGGNTKDEGSIAHVSNLGACFLFACPTDKRMERIWKKDYLLLNVSPVAIPIK